MHYWRQHRHGSLGGAEGRVTDKRPLMERFDSSDPEGCWLWTGKRSKKGYGRAGETVDGKYVHYQAHRFVYERLVGPIPEGLEIDHLCRNPPCVNPTHLEPVTRHENLARSTNPVRFALLYDTCAHGHALTPDNVYRRPDRPNARVCRACIRRYDREARIRKMEAALGGAA